MLFVQSVSVIHEIEGHAEHHNEDELCSLCFITDQPEDVDISVVKAENRFFQRSSFFQIYSLYLQPQSNYFYSRAPPTNT